MKNTFRFKTRIELCAELGISTSTLRRKLKALNIKLPTGDVSLKDQKVIYEIFGYPINVDKEDYEKV